MSDGTERERRILRERGECEVRALLSELKEVRGGRSEEKRGQRKMKYWKNIS